MQAQFYPSIEHIARLLGRFEGRGLHITPPHLRRKNAILSIHSSLAIEGNSLNLDEVTALINNKKVKGPRRDILEVQNAIQLYEQIQNFDPMDEKSFLKAHKVLMHKLVPQAGQFRNTQVGVFKQGQLVHQAPPARRVSQLMSQLFKWLQDDQKTHPIIKSCVGHYEIEFIHPFTDGNGRMGRFWQSICLGAYHKLFYFLPVEKLIRARQLAYYKALRASDVKGHATPFIDYMLPVLTDSLEKMLEHSAKPTREYRLELLKQHLAQRVFSRKDYIKIVGSISSATASRDLKHWVQHKLLTATGSHNNTRYRWRGG